MRNTKTTQELYEKLLTMPDLHSIPVLEGEQLFWPLYKQGFVRAYCDSYDTCIEINSTSAFAPSTHWHPDEEDMFDELYALGKRGNILVLKKTLLGTSVFYSGPSEDYSPSKRREIDFGRKKWEVGRLVYFEQI